MFSFFDQGNNLIAVEDLGQCLRAAGCLCTDVEVQNLTIKYDPNNTWRIDFEDFKLCAQELTIHNEIDTVPEIENAFNVFDKHENGMINIDELKHVLSRIGDVMSKEEMEAFIQ